MTDEMTNKSLSELAMALAELNDKELMEEFLKCILTESEISGVTSRWALVKKIDEGQTQRSIASELGLSLCKITRGSKELKKDNSAFKRVIDIYYSISQEDK